MSKTQDHIHGSLIQEIIKSFEDLRISHHDKHDYDLDILLQSLNEKPIASLKTDYRLIGDALMPDKWPDKQSFLMFMLIVLKMLLKDEGKEIKYYISNVSDNRYLSIVDKILKSLSDCELQLQLPIMIKDGEQRVSSLYDCLCTHLCAFMSVFNAPQMTQMEHILLTHLLSKDNLFANLLASDIWCFLSINSTPQLRYEHCCLLTNISLRCEDSSFTNVISLLTRLWSYLNPKYKKLYIQNYDPVSYTRIYKHLNVFLNMPASEPILPPIIKLIDKVNSFLEDQTVIPIDFLSILNQLMAANLNQGQEFLSQEDMNKINRLSTRIFLAMDEKMMIEDMDSTVAMIDLLITSSFAINDKDLLKILNKLEPVCLQPFISFSLVKFLVYLFDIELSQENYWNRFKKSITFLFKLLLNDSQLFLIKVLASMSLVQACLRLKDVQVIQECCKISQVKINLQLALNILTNSDNSFWSRQEKEKYLKIITESSDDQFSNQDEMECQSELENKYAIDIESEDEDEDEFDEVGIINAIKDMSKSIEQFDKQSNVLNSSTYKRKVLELYDNFDKVIKKMK